MVQNTGGDLLLPHDYELEKNVIGYILADPMCANYIPKLKDNDFYSEVNKLIFDAMKEKYNKKEPVELIGVADLIEKKGIEQPFNMLTEIINNVITTADFNYYLEKLKDYTTKRLLYYQAQELLRDIDNGINKDGPQLKYDFQAKLDGIETYNKNKHKDSIKDIVSEVIDDMHSDYTKEDDEKLYTGFYDLDTITAGLHNGELTIVAARPGIGKTAFAINLLINLAQSGNHSVLFTIEMSAKENVKRIISRTSRIDGHKLRLVKTLSKDELNSITNKVRSIQELPARIVDWIYDIGEMRAYCRERRNKGELDLIIIDYLQLAEVQAEKNGTRSDYVGKISRGLKKLAKEFDVPVIALAQLNRDAENNKRPTMRNLRESGSIEQDADNIIFLHVPDGTDEKASWFDILMIVEKQRNGPTGDIYLVYEKKTFNFKNKER